MKALQTVLDAMTEYGSPLTEKIYIIIKYSEQAKRDGFCFDVPTKDGLIKVGLCLADNKTLAKMTNATERQVERAIKQLWHYQRLIMPITVQNKFNARQRALVSFDVATMAYNAGRLTGLDRKKYQKISRDFS